MTNRILMIGSDGSAWVKSCKTDWTEELGYRIQVIGEAHYFASGRCVWYEPVPLLLTYQSREDER